MVLDSCKPVWTNKHSRVRIKRLISYNFRNAIAPCVRCSIGIGEMLLCLSDVQVQQMHHFLVQPTRLHAFCMRAAPFSS